MEWILLGIALVLIAANAVFVAAEFSLVTVERGDVEARAAAGERGAGGVLAGLRSLSTQLSGAQLGITITSLMVGFLASPSLAALISPLLKDLGLPVDATEGISLLLTLVLATGFQMIFGELVPKNIAIARPFRTAVAAVPFQRMFTTATGPLIRFLNGNANWLLRRIGIEPQEELASARSPEELLSLVRRSADAGTIERPMAALLSRSLSFGERSAGDVLTPRGRVFFVEAGTSIEDVIEQSRTSGHSRFPVIGPGGSDDILGVVALRTCLRVPEGARATTDATTVMDPPVVVPESMDLDDLLPVLRSGSHIAVVVDEYGGTAGVVTLEDLVEELVGEVQDEHDEPETRVIRREDGAFLLTGLLRTDELRELGIAAADHGEYDTVGGLIAYELGRIAAQGDSVRVGGWELLVERMDGMRVDLVQATPLRSASDDDAASGGPEGSSA